MDLMKNVVLSAVNLHKSYAGKLALKDVSIELREGEFVALLGPNGAGKSTLMQILTGLFSADAGEVTVLGFDLRKNAASALAEIGVVLQQPSLDIALSVNANLMFHARLHGLDRADAQQRINDGLVDIGLQDAAQSVVRSLSGGNRRKVELLRAMLHRPSLLLMDEASVGLDIVSRQQLLLTVQRLQQRDGVAVLWTTHLAEEIPFANRVIILRDGLKRFDDSLRMLYAQTAQTEPEAAFLHILDNATPCTSKTDFQ